MMMDSLSLLGILTKTSMATEKSLMIVFRNVESAYGNL